MVTRINNELCSHGNTRITNELRKLCYHTRIQAVGENELYQVDIMFFY